MRISSGEKRFCLLQADCITSLQPDVAAVIVSTQSIPALTTKPPSGGSGQCYRVKRRSTPALGIMPWSGVDLLEKEEVRDGHSLG